MENKNYRVWHVPQVPGEAFYVETNSFSESLKIAEVLAEYDLFQYENNIKPDYANAQGIEEYFPDEADWYEVDY